MRDCFQYVKNIDKKSFRKYGKVIEYSGYEKKGTKRNLWKVIHSSDTRQGWRVAYLILRDKSIGCLQMHPNTDETFEPIQGKAVLFLSLDSDLRKVEAFWLDQPVVVFSGIWHGIISIEEDAHMKIFENNQVRTKTLRLPFRLNVSSFTQRMQKKEN